MSKQPKKKPAPCTCPRYPFPHQREEGKCADDPVEEYYWSEDERFWDEQYHARKEDGKL